MAMMYNDEIELDEAIIKDFETGRRAFIPEEAFSQVLQKCLERTGKGTEFLERIKLLDTPGGKGELLSMYEVIMPLAEGKNTLSSPFVYRFEEDHLKLVPPRATSKLHVMERRP